MTRTDSGVERDSHSTYLGGPVAFAAALLSLTSLQALAAAPQEDMAGIPAPVAKQMRIHKIAPEDVSFFVRDPAQPGPMLAFNADVPRNPASTIKLLTTAAGLDILGPGYRWQTRAYVTGKIENGRLQGDLVLKGYGDPTLTSSDLWRLLWSLRERGIQTVAGDLILDDSFFEPPLAGRGDFDGNPTSAYNALPHALSVNSQTTRIHLLQDGTVNGVRVFTDPPLANLEIRNKLRLVDAPCKRKYHKPALRVVKDAGSTSLLLTGTFADACGESDYSRLLLDAGEHAAGAIIALWRAMQGEILGQVRKDVLPANARLLYTLESEPLEDGIQQINKFSNNLMSRTLFLTLGAEQQGAPGTLDKARRTIDRWLSNRGLDLPGLIVDNGSGLSRVTRITAEGMASLLDFAYSAPTMPQFLSSLSIAGVDGTMRKRFKRSPIKGRAHIKTGTLRGATAAAGYVLDRRGKRWIVASLINNPRLQAWRGKGIENTLIQWVYEQAGNEAGDVSSAAAGREPAGKR